MVLQDKSDFLLILELVSPKPFVLKAWQERYIHHCIKDRLASTCMGARQVQQRSLSLRVSPAYTSQ